SWRKKCGPRTEAALRAYILPVLGERVKCHAPARSGRAAKHLIPGTRTGSPVLGQVQQPATGPLAEHDLTHQQGVVHVLRNLLIATGAGSIFDLSHGIGAFALYDAIVGVAQIAWQYGLGLLELFFKTPHVVGETVVLRGDLLAHLGQFLL